MHYIAFIQVPGFYVRTLAGRNSELAGKPCVVHWGKAVLDASPEGLLSGVQIGMGLPEAKCLAREAAFLAWKEEDYSAAQERWLDVCAEHTCVIEPRAQHEAFLDLSSHGDPFDVAHRIAEELFERFGYEARIGLAGNKWIAELASEKVAGRGSQVAGFRASGLRPPTSDLQPIQNHSTFNLQAFVAPFPTDCLSPVLPEHRQRLVFLGYRTIGEVAKVPLAVLKEQFGPHGLRIYQVSRGGCFEAVRAQYPKDSLSAAFRYEGGAETREAIESGLKVLAKRLGSALKSRDSYGALVELELIFEEGGEKRARKFTKPIADARTVLAALRLMLEKPPFAPLQMLKVRLPRLEKISRAQHELNSEWRRLQAGEPFVARKGVDKRAVLRTVRGAFGDDAVKLASQISQPRRVKLLRAWKEATGWR